MIYTFDTPAPVVTVAPASGASVVAAASSSTPPNDAEALLGGQWVLNSTFSDEFNGTALDEAKWDTQYKNWTGPMSREFSTPPM